MTNLLDPLLTLLLNYGYPVIALCVICGYIGIPIPSNAILMAAGSFTIDGSLNIFILIPLVTAVAIIGDITGFLIGRKYGDLLIGKTFFKLGLSNKKYLTINKFLERWGVWCIFLSRWLLTPLAVPVNLAAGISNYSIRKFLLIALLGEFLWASIYIYLGNLFGSNWQIVSDYLKDTPLLLALIVVGLSSFAIALRMWKKGKLL